MPSESSSTSVVDHCGKEVTQIVGPVSLCMLLTTVLVQVLDGAGEGPLITQVGYDEKSNSGDSNGTKLLGAVLNAVILVVLIAVITALVYLLFKHGCVKCIYAYMGFSGFIILAFLNGALAVELIQLADWHLDWITFGFLLYNFSVVGVVALFVWPAPLLLRQAYLIDIGVVVAYVFTWVPEWSTWVLLLAMALYDIAAVSLPGGPLRALVELAEQRDTPIPALVFEGRGVEGSGPPRQPRSPTAPPGPVAEAEESRHSGAEALEDLTWIIQSNATPRAARSGASAHTPFGAASGGTSGDVSGAPLLHPPRPLQDNPVYTPSDIPPVGDAAEEIELADLRLVSIQLSETDPELLAQDASVPVEPRRRRRRRRRHRTDGIKLGLGDFIFYSMLVGRASMHTIITAVACALAIVAGLGITLLMLSIWQKALPALPVSIALGTAIYFLHRFVVEPFVTDAARAGLYF